MAGASMEIHKPKAAHSWGEFLIEIGTIICGILIALGLEQGVEALHQNHLREEARDAIRGELSRNLDQFRRRAEVQTCVDTRLRDLEAVLVRTPVGGRPPRPLWVGRPQIWSMTESRWIASTSGARTSLLPAEEQGSFSELYALDQEFEQAENIEQIAWTHLRTLETLPTLDGPTRDHLIEALHEARYANFRIKITAAQARERAAAIGLSAIRSPYPEGSRSACIPMNTSREDAMKNTISGRTAIAEP